MRIYRVNFLYYNLFFSKKQVKYCDAVYQFLLLYYIDNCLFLCEMSTDCGTVIAMVFRNKCLTKQRKCDIILSLSGCGAVGSALPWGGRGRPFKSGHSDQARFCRDPERLSCRFAWEFFCFHRLDKVRKPAYNRGRKRNVML